MLAAKDIISQSLAEIKEYASGKKQPVIKTSLDCLNRVLGGGVPWKTCTIIAAPSGGGKTTLINAIDFELFDLNYKKQPFVYIFFSLEISPLMLIAKKACALLNTTLDKVLSFKEKLSPEKIKRLESLLEPYKDLPIYFHSSSVTGDEIEAKVKALHSTYVKQNPNVGIVMVTDHAGLVSSDKDEEENKIISGFSKNLINIKNDIPKSITIVLSQFNSRIEEPVRLMTPTLHFPMKSDLFGSKTIWHAADNVIMLNRPELLNISYYGPTSLPTKDRIYAHIIKQRYGELGMFVLDSRLLQYSKLIEYIE